MRALLLALLLVAGCASPRVQEPDDDDDAANDDDDSAGDDDDSTAAAVCVDDSLEDNDDFASARTIAPGAYNNLTACPFDDDWYAVTIPARFRVTVQAVFQHGDGDIDIALRNESGEILDTSSSVTDNEQVGPLILFVEQVLYVEVDLLGFGGDPPGNTYGIAILTEPLPN